MPYKDPKSEKAILSRQKRAKKYYEKNKEKIAIKNKTEPNRLKSLRINNWKRRGVAGDLNALYELWENTDKCEGCDYIFTNDSNKCLDHDHITGEFRKILCRNCNNWDKYYNI
jgi:hypothetical protein